MCLKLMLKQNTKFLDLFMGLILVFLKALKQLLKTSYVLGLCTSLPVFSELNLCIKRSWKFKGDVKDIENMNKG